jgi:hypothetical protein
LVYQTEPKWKNNSSSSLMAAISNFLSE